MKLIESFFSLRTIYQLNLDKTISFENYIQSIDVFFQEFLESNEDISDQVFPELDLGTIDLIFEQIELLADLFKIPIDSEWVLETLDNLKISIVGFNSNNKTEFSCAFGLGKIVGKTSAYTTYYRYREKKKKPFLMSKVRVRRLLMGLSYSWYRLENYIPLLSQINHLFP